MAVVAEGIKQRKPSKAETTTVDKEDKPKPVAAPTKPLLDDNAKKNAATIANFLLPALILIYLGLTLQKYSASEYAYLFPNKYALLGFKNVDALKKALLDNMRDSAIWGLTYLYVRRYGNPEFRPKTHTFVQDGYFGALSSFSTTLIKQLVNNFFA